MANRIFQFPKGAHILAPTGKTATPQYELDLSSGPILDADGAPVLDADGNHTYPILLDENGQKVVAREPYVLAVAGPALYAFPTIEDRALGTHGEKRAPRVNLTAQQAAQFWRGMLDAYKASGGSWPDDGTRPVKAQLDTFASFVENDLSTRGYVTILDTSAKRQTAAKVATERPNPFASMFAAFGFDEAESPTPPETI